MNSYFLLIKYAAVKMEQGPHLGTNEEVGLLHSNSWRDFLASQILYIHTKAWSWAWSSCGQGGLKSTDLVFWAARQRQNQCCILWADGDYIFASHLLPVSVILHSLLAELCSLRADQTMYPSSWLTCNSTRAHSNVVSFLPLKLLSVLKLVLVSLCQRLCHCQNEKEG